MATNIAIFSGGDPYGNSATPTLLPDIAEGVYTTVILWAAHINADGSINFNDCAVAANGQFNADAASWADQVLALRQNGTINRIELSIGGDSSSFQNIETLIGTYGIGSSNPLYGNLQVLQTTLQLDAIDYDDESNYDAGSSAQLATMCGNLGMKVSICPYALWEQQYWVNLVNTINGASPGQCDAVYLQCYDGGAGNSPSQWNSAFASTGLSMNCGMWATHKSGKMCTSFSTHNQVEIQMSAWARETPLAGGFMFCGTDMLNCPGGGTPAQYASAIQSGLGG